jgi:SsrA-binding protein
VTSKRAPNDPAGDDIKIVATNRQARRDFEILDSLECGMMLKGNEVKSLRESKVTLADAYARIHQDELWVFGLHIAPYSHAGAADLLEPARDRKLLANRTEIDRWAARVDQQHLTLVPLRLYFKGGRAKLELGLGRGKKQYDKRQDLAKREADREAEKAMSRAIRQRTE